MSPGWWSVCSGSPPIARTFGTEIEDVVFSDSVPADRLDRAFQTLMLDVLGVDSDEQTYEHGDLLCVSRRFDHAVELHFPLSKTEGVAIALDAAAVDQMGDPVWHLHAIIADAE